MEASADRISRWTFSSLLILSLLQQYDSEPTLTPVIGNKLYVTSGSSSFDLSWNYNTDGRTIKEVALKYVGTGNNDVTVAERTPTSRLQVSAASFYSGRITFFGSLTANVGKITFRISNIVQSDSRIFKCDLSFMSFNPPDVQNAVELVVIVRPRFNPPHTLPTTKLIRNENESVEYTCVAEAKPYAVFVWMLNGKNLTHTPPYNITERIIGPSSKIFTTFAYLNIKHLTWQQYGNFSCVAINEAGTRTQRTELEVRYRPVVQSPSDHPQSIVLTEGETASFYCKTTGNPPATAHKWQFNGNDLPGESCSLCTSTTLIIRSVAKKDEGWYGCVGSNSMGEGPRAEAQLSIKPLSTSPVPGIITPSPAMPTTRPSPMSVRLVGGNWPGEGRVEIYYRGRWGTVCDDLWDINDARVVCRQLGYPSAVSAPHRAFFGQGSGRIWLDNVQCQGNESSIVNCRHLPWGAHNCGHTEDASVVCSNYSIPLPSASSVSPTAAMSTGSPSASTMPTFWPSPWTMATPRPSPTTMATPRPSPTRPRFAFTISCFPSAIVAYIARDSLPLGSDPRLLHLNNPSCGVNYVTKKSVIIKAPLKGCGTVRRNIGYKVSFHNKLVVPFGYGNKRSLSVFPFKCVYSHFGFP